jgi:hypothetical protein
VAESVWVGYWQGGFGIGRVGWILAVWCSVKMQDTQYAAATFVVVVVGLGGRVRWRCQMELPASSSTG